MAFKPYDILSGGPPFEPRIPEGGGVASKILGSTFAFRPYPPEPACTALQIMQNAKTAIQFRPFFPKRLIYRENRSPSLRCGETLPFEEEVVFVFSREGSPPALKMLWPDRRGAVVFTNLSSPSPLPSRLGHGHRDAPFRSRRTVVTRFAAVRRLEQNMNYFPPFQGFDQKIHDRQINRKSTLQCKALSLHGLRTPWRKHRVRSRRQSQR